VPSEACDLYRAMMRKDTAMAGFDTDCDSVLKTGRVLVSVKF
jgi:hypothetical protein